MLESSVELMELQYEDLSDVNDGEANIHIKTNLCWEKKCIAGRQLRLFEIATFHIACSSKGRLRKHFINPKIADDTDRIIDNFYGSVTDGSHYLSIYWM